MTGAFASEGKKLPRAAIGQNNSLLRSLQLQAILGCSACVFLELGEFRGTGVRAMSQSNAPVSCQLGIVIDGLSPLSH